MMTTTMYSLLAHDAVWAGRLQLAQTFAARSIDWISGQMPKAWRHAVRGAGADATPNGGHGVAKELVEVDGNETADELATNCEGDQTCCQTMATDLQRRRSSRYPTRAIREAIAAGRAIRFDTVDAVEMDMKEANAVANSLGRNLGAMDGHKFAVGLRRSGDGRILGMAVCSRPRQSQYDDAMTAEVRALIAVSGTRQGRDAILRAVASRAAAQGYRRLVMQQVLERDVCEALAEAGWEIGIPLGPIDPLEARLRIVGGRQQSQSVWTKVLPGEPGRA